MDAPAMGFQRLACVGLTATGNIHHSLYRLLLRARNACPRVTCRSSLTGLGLRLAATKDCMPKAPLSLLPLRTGARRPLLRDGKQRGTVLVRPQRGRAVTETPFLPLPPRTRIAHSHSRRRPANRSCQTWRHNAVPSCSRCQMTDALWVCLALKGGPGAARQRNREAERALLTFLSPQLAQGSPCPSAQQAKPAQRREHLLFVFFRPHPRSCFKLIDRSKGEEPGVPSFDWRRLKRSRRVGHGPASAASSDLTEHEPRPERGSGT